MEIKNTTVYDNKTLEEFIAFSIHKGKNPKGRRRAFNIIFPILLGVLSIEIGISFLWEITESLWLLILMFILCLFILIAINFIMPKFFKKNNQRLAGSELHYVFLDDEFSLKVQTAKIKCEETVKYSFLYKVFETKDYMYLYVNIAAVYIVDKSNFEDTTSMQIRKAISSQLPPKKYIVCKQ